MKDWLEKLRALPGVPALERLTARRPLLRGLLPLPLIALVFPLLINPVWRRGLPLMLLLMDVALLWGVAGELKLRDQEVTRDARQKRVLMLLYMVVILLAGAGLILALMFMIW